MAKRVSSSEAKRIAELRESLGDRTFRTLMTGGNKRLMRPERMGNLTGGRGTLKPWERERLALISRNSQALQNLKTKREVPSSQEYKVNRAVRTWLVRGKERDIPYESQGPKTRGKQQKAIRALKYLGIDPTEKHYYVRKVAA
jgi:hypothetical protein